MPIQTGTTNRGTGPAPAQPDWQGLATAAKYAFADMVNAWIAGSKVRAHSTEHTCWILGSLAELRKGSLCGDIGPSAGIPGMRAVFEATPGISREIASVVAEELYDAWTSWAAGYEIKLGAAFPPMWNVHPTGQWTPWSQAGVFGVDTTGASRLLTILKKRLEHGRSAEEYRLHSGELSRRILERIRQPTLPRQAAALRNEPLAALRVSADARLLGRPVLPRTTGGAATRRPPMHVAIAQASPGPAIGDLTQWIATRFRQFMRSAEISHLWGMAIAPGNPLVNLAGPVLMGTIVGGGAPHSDAPPVIVGSFPYP